MAYALFLASSAALMVGVSSTTSSVHTRIDDSIRGRVMPVWSTASLGVRPLGALVNGAVGDAAGIRIAFLVAALTPLAALAFGLVIRRHNGESGAPD